MPKVVLLSNFLNHHQLPLSMAMRELTENHYTFVATKPMPQSFSEFGYYNMNDQYEFVLKAYESKENEMKAIRLSEDSDVVIIGSAPEHFVRNRILEGKQTFHYSERLFKNGYFGKRKIKGTIPLIWPNFLLSDRKYKRYINSKNNYLLCAGCYSAGDYALCGLYKNRTFKWGYFPDASEKMIHHFNGETVKLLWVGRFISWKHPENAVDVAFKLKLDGIKFKLNLIGSGELSPMLQSRIQAKNLTDCVHLLGSMHPDEVRQNMENSDVFLFTSDYNEGWGAVLNEAMSSGCAVVASKAAGATGYLIEDGVNGFTYSNPSELYGIVKRLCTDYNVRMRIGRNAFDTIHNLWNADVAASRLLKLSDALKKGDDSVFSEGPCSVAKREYGGFLLV